MSSGRAIRRMSQDEFLEWWQNQEVSFELVDGVPVAMAGAKRAHDRIVVNAIRSLANQLEGSMPDTKGWMRKSLFPNPP